MFSADLGGYTAPPPAATDPPFQKVALLLNGDGTNGAQNNTFVDSSSNNFTITRTGNVAQGTFSPFSLAEGQWSNYFDGSGDYLSVPLDSVNIRTAFTIESWCFITTRTGFTNFCGSTSTSAGQSLYLQQFGGIVYFGDGATNNIKFADTSLPVNSWFHCACTFDGTTYSVFINGTSVGSSTTLLANNTLLSTQIGARTVSNPGAITGYISNFRVVKGTAVYTANFTPPTSPLTAITNTSLLTCQSNRFKDNSSNNFTITPAGDTKVTAFSPFAPSAAYDASTNGGSGYFDGSGDYLSVPDSSGFQFGTDNFTIEFWLYPTRLANWWICGKGDAATAAGSAFSFYNGGTWDFYYGSSSLGITRPTITANEWQHIAVVRNGSTITIYKNGVSVSTGNIGSNSINTGGSNPVRLGQYSIGAYPGYVNDFRIVKGTALYTSNFTPPTAPLTAVANTQLLINCTNAGIIDNSGKNDIETVGNAQISTSVKKYGTGSMYFDGTGDRLLMSSEATQFGTGNFTIEFWAYRLSSGAGWRVCVANYLTWASGSFFFGGDTGESGINFGSNTTGDHIITSGSPFPQNTWTHLAVVRSGSIITIYSNGVSVGSFTDSTNYSLSQGTLIGGIPGTFPNEFNGYIDDLRITKGQALYTSNFIPPTQAFPNV